MRVSRFALGTSKITTIYYMGKLQKKQWYCDTETDPRYIFLSGFLKTLPSGGDEQRFCDKRLLSTFCSPDFHHIIDADRLRDYVLMPLAHSNIYSDPHPRLSAYHGVQSSAPCGAQGRRTLVLGNGCRVLCNALRATRSLISNAPHQHRLVIKQQKGTGHL